MRNAMEPSSSSADLGIQSAVSDMTARQRPVLVSSGKHTANCALWYAASTSIVQGSVGSVTTTHKLLIPFHLIYEHVDCGSQPPSKVTRADHHPEQGLSADW